jgi:hypothetical protein
MFHSPMFRKLAARTRQVRTACLSLSAARWPAAAAQSPLRPLLLGMLCAALACSAVPPASGQDEEVGKFEVHEWSLWAIDSTQDLANGLDQYSSAMPGPVETERTRVPKEHKATPVAVMTFHGEPTPELEVEVQIPSGRVLANWPPARRKNNRLRWLELNQSAQPFEGARVAAVDASHWFTRARMLDCLYLKSGGRQERFLTYDIELPLAVPLRLEGGPDTYRVVNLSPWELADVIISVPTPEGRRIGRLAAVPPQAAAAPAAAAPQVPPAAGTGQPSQHPADAASQTSPQSNAAPAGEPPQPQPADTSAERQPAKDASPQQPGAQQLSGRAGERAAPDGAQPASGVSGGPPSGAQQAGAPAGVEISMSAPLPEDAAEFAALRSELVQSLLAAGLTHAEAELAVGLVADCVLQSSELVVLVRLPQSAADEKLPLVFYPAAARTVRVPLLLIRKVDPRIQDELRQLVAQLGSASFAEREAADKRLRELGRLAIPILRECLTSPDLEVVLRAERILRAMNESIEPQQPNNPAAQGAAVPAAAVQVPVAPGF